MTAISKKLPDQTAAARPRQRSPRRRPELRKTRKTRDTRLPASKISPEPAADGPAANAFAESKGRSLDRPEIGPTPIPHRSVTQQNRR